MNKYSVCITVDTRCYIVEAKNDKEAERAALERLEEELFTIPYTAGVSRVEQEHRNERS